MLPIKSLPQTYKNINTDELKQIQLPPLNNGFKGIQFEINKISAVLDVHLKMPISCNLHGFLEFKSKDTAQVFKHILHRMYMSLTQFSNDPRANKMMCYLSSIIQQIEEQLDYAAQRNTPASFTYKIILDHIDKLRVFKHYITLLIPEEQKEHFIKVTQPLDVFYSMKDLCITNLNHPNLSTITSFKKCLEITLAEMQRLMINDMSEM